MKITMFLPTSNLSHPKVVFPFGHSVLLNSFPTYIGPRDIETRPEGLTRFEDLNNFYDFSLDILDTQTAIVHSVFYQIEFDERALINRNIDTVVDIMLSEFSRARDKIKVNGETDEDRERQLSFRFRIANNSVGEEQFRKLITNIVIKASRGNKNTIEALVRDNINYGYQISLHLPRGIHMTFSPTLDSLDHVHFLGKQHYFSIRHQNKPFELLEYTTPEVIQKEFAKAMILAFPFLTTMSDLETQKVDGIIAPQRSALVFYNVWERMNRVGAEKVEEITA